jgi:hypothetical protein
MRARNLAVERARILHRSLLSKVGLPIPYVIAKTIAEREDTICEAYKLTADMAARVAGIHDLGRGGGEV